MWSGKGRFQLNRWLRNTRQLFCSYTVVHVVAQQTDELIGSGYCSFQFTSLIKIYRGVTFDVWMHVWTFLRLKTKDLIRWCMLQKAVLMHIQLSSYVYLVFVWYLSATCLINTWYSIRHSPSMYHVLIRHLLSMHLVLVILLLSMHFLLIKYLLSSYLLFIIYLRTCIIFIYGTYWVCILYLKDICWGMCIELFLDIYWVYTLYLLDT